MAYIKGEDINLGVQRETVRGTAEDPAIYVAARTPTGVRQVVDKVDIKETKGTGMTSQGETVVQKRVEGDLEFNVKDNSIGFFLLSLLGKDTVTSMGTGAYSHLFEILTGNPQNPTLSLSLAQLGQQDYQYAKCLCTSLEIKTPVDDLVNAKATFVGASEATHADFTVAFPSNEYYFRHYDVVIKIATNVAGLGAASALSVKEFGITIANNGRVNQNIGELNPGDVFAMVIEVNGTLKRDYMDETFHDLYAGELYKAMSITMKRTDIDIDSSGTTANPTVSIVMPKVSFKDDKPDRPIDDIAGESVDFMAHFDDTLGYGIQVTVVNETVNYN